LSLLPLTPTVVLAFLASHDIRIDENQLSAPFIQNRETFLLEGLSYRQWTIRMPVQYVDRVVALAKENGILAGVTGGGNDGSVFSRYGTGGCGARMAVRVFAFTGAK